MTKPETLYGIMSLRVLDENGDPILEDLFLKDTSLKYDPNPELTITAVGTGEGREGETTER